MFFENLLQKIVKNCNTLFIYYGLPLGREKKFFNSVTDSDT
jgi:hypothetical protein